MRSESEIRTMIEEKRLRLKALLEYQPSDWLESVTGSWRRWQRQELEKTGLIISYLEWVLGDEAKRAEDPGRP